MTHRSTTHRARPSRLDGALTGAIAGAIAATVVALVLLAGLGLAPPRIFGDPLGLDGAPVRVRIGGDSRTTAVGTARGDFDDVATLLAPERFELELPLAATAAVEVPAGTDPPDTVVLTGLTLDVTVSDARSSATFPMVASGDAVLVRNGDRYGLPPVVFSARLSGPQLDRLRTVLSGGGANTAVAALGFTATSAPDLPAGSGVALAFGAGSGALGF